MEKKKYNITVGNETKEFEEGTTYQAVAKEFCGSFSHPAVLAVEGENRLQELRKTVEKAQTSFISFMSDCICCRNKLQFTVFLNCFS